MPRVYVKDDKLIPREHNVDMQSMILDVRFELELNEGLVDWVKSAAKLAN